MKQTTQPNVSYAELEKRIREEIMPLFESIIAGEQIFYVNRNKESCWEAIEDVPCRCPAAIEAEADIDDPSVFSMVDRLSGDPMRPDQACASCEIYKNLCPTIVEELGEAFNSIVHILGTKNIAIGDAENLTRELAHSLESRDKENFEIRERLLTDALTGVSNRRHMNERMVEEVNRCHNRRRLISVLMVDIDDFKKYNDTYGHVAGDRVLARLGKILRGSLRNYDQAFRYGGEEFVIMLPETDTKEAMIVAERIRTRFAEVDFRVPGAGHNPGPGGNLTLSGGLVTYRRGMGVVELLECADGALYRAKKNGKNKIELDEALVGV